MSTTTLDELSARHDVLSKELDEIGTELEIASSLFASVCARLERLKVARAILDAEIDREMRTLDDEVA